MAETAIQGPEGLRPPETAHWHPLSPDESRDSEENQMPAESGYFGQQTPSAAEATPFAEPQRLAEPLNLSEPKQQSQEHLETPRVLDLDLSLPAAPHKLTASALLTHLSNYESSHKETLLPVDAKDSTVTPDLWIPVIQSLARQREELENALAESQTVAKAQISALQTIIEQQAPSISSQAVQRNLIRARASSLDQISLSLSPPSASRHVPILKTWDLNLGTSPLNMQQTLDKSDTSYHNTDPTSARDDAVSCS